jgi:hypothetical protein
VVDAGLQMWPEFRGSKVFDTWRRHFRMRIITPPHPFMDTSRHYLCAQFPHATFPMACWLNPALVGFRGSGMPPSAHIHSKDLALMHVAAELVLQA